MNITITPHSPSVITVTFNLVDDMIWEDSEEFHIILSIMDDSTSCGSLGTQSSIRIRIALDFNDRK